MLRGLAAGLLCGVVVVALLEIIIRTFDAFARERQIAMVDVTPPTPPTGTPVPPRAILHPFVGFTQDAGATTSEDDASGDAVARRLFGDDYAHVDPAAWPTTVNAQGFVSHITDYRTVDPSRFVIGVFGGSVAQNFANATEKMLKADFARALGMDEAAIEVLTFAKAGYKQPQQVITLLQALLLGIPLDVVVEIDGFNEAALGGFDCNGGYHPLFPSSQHYLTILHLLARDTTPDTMEQALAVLRLRSRGRWLRSMRVSPWVQRSEAARTVLGIAIERTDARAAVEEQRLQEASAADPRGGIPIPHLDDPRLGSAASCPDLIADLWLRSSLAMAALAAQWGLPYVQVLQPNQYVGDTKPLSEEEKAIAWAPAHSWSRNAAAGYPALRARSRELVDRGVPFHDLTDVFAGHPETLYFDKCCHINLRGNRILLEALAPLITEQVTRGKLTPGHGRRGD